MSKFSDADRQELERLEREFDEAGGMQVAEPRFVKDDGSPAEGLMDGRFNYAGGNDRYDRICELRTERGDATFEVKLRVYFTVRVRGEGMSEEELAQAIGPKGVARSLERVVRDTVMLRDLGDNTLGYAPDGCRAAWIEELVSVDLVEERER